MGKKKSLPFFSNELENLLIKMDEKVSKSADESILKNINEKLSTLFSSLNNSFWAWKYIQQIIGKTKFISRERGELKVSIVRAINYLEKYSGANTDSIELSKFDGYKDQTTNLIDEINEKIIGVVSNWRDDIERRCHTLEDFQDILTKKDLTRVNKVEDFLPGKYLEIEKISESTGKKESVFSTNKKKWTQLLKEFEEVESSLSNDALQKRFNLSKQSVVVLNRLLKGDNITLSDISDKILLELSNSPKLGSIIDLEIGSRN